MKLFYTTLLIIIFIINNSFAQLLISEIAPATSGEDWVELYYNSAQRDSLEISSYFVTMYYGTNENLSDQPVTIYSYNRPETPYDDRFIVVHLTNSAEKDETDLTGDTNKNGQIDIYCNNYYNSLWNSDCIVAIDTNDTYQDGMLDFVAYSNYDKSLNSSVLKYLEYAINNKEWQSSINLQDSLFKIPQNGLTRYQSICRLNYQDNNNKNDFTITKFQTPGQKNKIHVNIPGNKKIFTLHKKKIFSRLKGTNRPTCLLTIFNPCKISLKVFSRYGQLIFKSKLYSEVHPGSFKLTWNISHSKKIRTGIYYGLIEAASSRTKSIQTQKFIFIISRW